MKNPIKEFLKNSYISTLSYPEIIASIQEKKEQITALKEEIVLITTESSDLANKYAQSLKELEDRRDDFFKHLDSDLNRLKKESEKAEAALTSLNNDHQLQLADINKKIANATEQKKIQLQQLLTANETEFNHQKNELLEQLEKLRNAQADQLKIFDNSFNELNKQYSELLGALQNEQGVLKDTLKSEEKRLADQQQELNRQIKAAEASHQNDLQQLTLNNTQKTQELQKSNDSELMLMREELSSLMKEAATLTASRDRLKKELSEQKKRAAEEYAQKSDFFQIQQQQAEAINTDLVKEIERKKAEYQQLDQLHRDLLKNKGAIYELFLTVSKKADSVEDKEKVAQLAKQPEYQDFIAQLEKINTQKSLLKEELSTLNYRLLTEQEQLQSRLSYFDERIANHKEELTSKIAQLQKTNAQLEQDITATQKDYLLKIDQLKAELDETVATNKKTYEQAEKDLKQQLFELQKKYQQENAQLAQKLANVADEVNSLQEENAQLESKLTSLKAHSKKTIADLKAEQEAFVLKAKESKRELDQQLKQIDAERLKTVEDLKERQKVLINSELEKHLLNYNSQKETIEKALSELSKTKSAQYAEFNKTIANIEQEYTALITQLDNKNKELQQQYSDLAEHYQQEIKSYQEVIADDNAKTAANMQALEDKKKQDLESLRATAHQELAQANEQLSAANGNLSFLRKQKESLSNELTVSQEDAEEQLSKLNIRYENERTALELELADLKLSLKSKEDYFLKEKQYCDQKLSELYSLHCSQEKELQELSEQNTKQLKDTYANLANELAAYVADLYAILESKQNQHEQDLKILQLRLDKENEQQSARNAYLKTKLENKRSEYEKRVDSLGHANDDMQKALVDLQIESENKLSKLLEEKLAVIKANEAAIADQQAVGEQEKEAYAEELAAAVANINSEKHKVLAAAAELAKECELKRSELDNKRSAAVRQIIDLNAQQKDYVEKIDAEIAKAKAAIEELQNENAAVISSKQEQIANFDEQVQAATLAHLENKKQLSAEYHLRLSELQQQHAIKIAEADQQQQQALAQLQEENAERLARIEDNAHKIEAALLSEKEELEQGVVKLDEELEKRMNDSTAARQQLQQVLEQMNNDYQQLYLEHQTKMNLIQEDYHNRLVQLKQEHETELAEAKKTGEQEIDNLQADLMKAKTKLQHLNSENAYYDAQLQLIDVDFENKEKDIETKRSEKQEVFEELSSKYVALKKLCDEEYQQLNEELLAKQEALSALKQRQNQELEDIHAHQIKIIDSIVERNEHHLNEQIEMYEVASHKAEEDCDLRIKTVKEELEQAKAQLADYKETIKRKSDEKKGLFEQQYQKVIEAKEKLERELAFVKADYQEKVQLYADAYAKREGEIKRVLQDFEEANDKALEDSKNALEAKCQGLKDEYSEVQQQLVLLNAKKQELIDGLSTYRHRKNEELQQISLEVNNKTQEVVAQIQNIFEMKAQLADLHKERIAAIKQQIVATAEEYDFATRNHSAALANARSQEAEAAKDILAAKTKEFKNKLLQLENSHQETLQLLNDLTEETIAELAKTIQDVENERSAETEAHQLKLTTISESYGLLINQEKERILALKEEITDIKDSLNKKRDENTSLKQQLDEYFKTRKQQIDERSLLQREQLAEEFRLKMTDESLKVAESKADIAKLNEEILELNHRYEEVDQQLLKERDNLLLTYVKQIEEAGKAYEEAVASYKKKRQADDKVSGVISSLFKKH